MNDEFVEVISKYIFQDLNGIKKQKPRNIHLEVQYSKSLYQCACSLKRVHIVDMVAVIVPPAPHLTVHILYLSLIHI